MTRANNGIHRTAGTGTSLAGMLVALPQLCTARAAPGPPAGDARVRCSNRACRPPSDWLEKRVDR